MTGNYDKLSCHGWTERHPQTQLCPFNTASWHIKHMNIRGGCNMNTFSKYQNLNVSSIFCRFCSFSMARLCSILSIFAPNAVEKNTPNAVEKNTFMDSNGTKKALLLLKWRISFALQPSQGGKKPVFLSSRPSGQHPIEPIAVPNETETVDTSTWKMMPSGSVFFFG